MKPLARQCLLGLTAAALITGCASPKVTPMQSVVTAPNDKFPAVSVFYKTPSKKLAQECSTFDDSSTTNYCHVNTIQKAEFEKKLIESKYFEDVHSHVQDIEYNVLITTAEFKHEGAAELSQAVVAGLTLLMVPTKTTSRVKTEVAVLWRDIPLKLYEYELPLERHVSILSPNAIQAGIQIMEADLATRFLKDAEKDRVFSAAFLNQQLKATDYEKELIHPQQIGDFVFQGQHIYPHPLAGTQLRFRHKLFDFDYIDAFVYPIRETDWSNTEKALASEVENFRKEVELAQREGLTKNVSLGATESISWDWGNNNYKGKKISGTVIGKDNEEYRTFMYLFAKEDKFIKFRASFVKTENEPNIEEALKQSLAQFNVPKESLFMARLRQHQRENKIQ